MSRIFRCCTPVRRRPCLWSPYPWRAWGPLSIGVFTQLDLGARHAVEAILGLVGQELGGLVEEVDVDELKKMVHTDAPPSAEAPR